MSATHSWFGAVAVNCRSTRPAGRSVSWAGRVVRGLLAGPDHPTQTGRAHEALDRAAGHLQALAQEGGVDLVRPVDAVVGLVHPADLPGSPSSVPTNTHTGPRRTA
ncbi:hypothetical protein GCM10010129_81380 [Streptomyces fumigatiscleroticus]|nr:hypothetical protein GCM10010129_81380 [Streptomyces fumigatiscleroticus]